MVLRVADKDGAILIDPDAVGPGEATLQRIAVRAVMLGASADLELETTGLSVDHADRVGFRVDQPGVAGGIDRDALRAAEGGELGGATVAGEALLAGAGDVRDLVGFEVELEDLIAFAGADPEVAGGVEVDGARALERRALNRGAVGGFAGLARACDGRDHLRLHIDLADDVVADVADKEVAVRVELDAVRLLQLGLFGGATVAGVTWLARADDRRDDAGLGVNLADGVVLHVHDEEITALRSEAEFVGQVERCGGGGAAVAGVAGFAGSGDERDLAILVDAADALAAVFTIPDGTIRAADDAKRIVHRRGGGRTAVSRVSLFTVTGEGRDRRGRKRSRGQEGKEAEEHGKKDDR